MLACELFGAISLKSVEEEMKLWEINIFRPSLMCPHWSYDFILLKPQHQVVL